MNTPQILAVLFFLLAFLLCFIEDYRAREKK